MIDVFILLLKQQTCNNSENRFSEGCVKSYMPLLQPAKESTLFRREPCSFFRELHFRIAFCMEEMTMGSQLTSTFLLIMDARILINALYVSHWYFFSSDDFSCESLRSPNWFLPFWKGSEDFTPTVCRWHIGVLWGELGPSENAEDHFEAISSSHINWTKRFLYPVNGVITLFSQILGGKVGALPAEFPGMTLGTKNKSKDI